MLYFEMLTMGAPPESQYRTFKISMYGMMVLRQMMDLAGLLDWEVDVSEDDFPEIPEDPESEEYAQAVDKIREVLSFTSPDPSRIPGAKFCSNDRWIINQNECHLVADTLSSFVESLPEDWTFDDDNGKEYPQDVIKQMLELTDAWIKYNRYAAKYNGYIVD